jgi:hypothetical protein
VECEFFFYLNKAERRCDLCSSKISQCKSCYLESPKKEEEGGSERLFCQECLPGYYLDEQSQNCLECKVENCKKCQPS